MAAHQDRARATLRSEAGSSLAAGPRHPTPRRQQCSAGVAHPQSKAGPQIHPPIRIQIGRLPLQPGIRPQTLLIFTLTSTPAPPRRYLCNADCLHFIARALTSHCPKIPKPHFSFLETDSLSLPIRNTVDPDLNLRLRLRLRLRLHTPSPLLLLR